MDISKNWACGPRSRFTPCRVHIVTSPHIADRPSSFDSAADAQAFCDGWMNNRWRFRRHALQGFRSGSIDTSLRSTCPSKPSHVRKNIDLGAPRGRAVFGRARDRGYLVVVGAQCIFRIGFVLTSAGMTEVSLVRETIFAIHVLGRAGSNVDTSWVKSHHGGYTG